MTDQTPGAAAEAACPPDIHLPHFRAAFLAGAAWAEGRADERLKQMSALSDIYESFLKAQKDRDRWRECADKLAVGLELFRGYCTEEFAPHPMEHAAEALSDYEKARAGETTRRSIR